MDFFFINQLEKTFYISPWFLSGKVFCFHRKQWTQPQNITLGRAWKALSNDTYHVYFCSSWYQKKMIFSLQKPQINVNYEYSVWSLHIISYKTRLNRKKITFLQNIKGILVETLLCEIWNNFSTSLINKSVITQDSVLKRTNLSIEGILHKLTILSPCLAGTTPTPSSPLRVHSHSANDIQKKLCETTRSFEHISADPSNTLELQAPPSVSENYPWPSGFPQKSTRVINTMTSSSNQYLDLITLTNLTPEFNTIFNTKTKNISTISIKIQININHILEPHTTHTNIQPTTLQSIRFTIKDTPIFNHMSYDFRTTQPR